VTEATEAYRAEMDIVGLFVQDAFVPDPKAVTPSKTLYEAFREWCAENGHELLTPKQFGRRLSAKGFTCGRARVEGKLCRCWFGLRLRNENDPQPDLLPPSEPTDEPVTLVTLVTLKRDTADVLDQRVTNDTIVTPQPANTPSDIEVAPEKSENGLQQTEKFVDTEKWLDELCAELTATQSEPT
jgi:phage/plasmid-associated DNA primase